MERVELDDFEPRIIGIGASAGGIEALRTLFQSLPPHPSTAFVVIQHRSPGIGALAYLLATWSRLTVHVAVDGQRPERGCVYLAEPDHVLSLDRGTFRTRPSEKRARHPAIETIDAFFESLAADRKERAIAVVLSGTGSDGTAGAICVKQAGGVVLVQDPGTAEQGSMPQSVIDHQAADHVLAPAQLATQLFAFGTEAHAVDPRAYAGEISALTEVVARIRTQAGIDLRKYKSTPLLWRLERRMHARGSSSLGAYAELLRDDPAELHELIRNIPIHVTEFFRDDDAWSALSKYVISTHVGSGEPFRAWTPACATGEEAYSVAMVLAEHAVRFQIFATDASAEIVTRASTGTFSAEVVQQLSEARRARFLDAMGDAYRIKRSLRENMVFAPHDLMSDPPFAGLDLVTCRSLLTYLGPEASERVVSLLHGALRPGGYLFLGTSEGLRPDLEGFETISLPWRIYRKTDAVLVSGGTALEASREELQAVNRELRASNDQLAVANDELLEANRQLRARVVELELQSGVLNSSGVATLFLDGDLRIRWFTSAVSEVFPIQKTDTGRQITDLVKNFEDPRFLADIAAVVRTGDALEAEVRGSEARWFLRRISPHLRGVAVTFTDITDGRNASDALRDDLAGHPVPRP